MIGPCPLVPETQDQSLQRQIGAVSVYRQERYQWAGYSSTNCCGVQIYVVGRWVCQRRRSSDSQMGRWRMAEHLSRRPMIKISVTWTVAWCIRSWFSTWFWTLLNEAKLCCRPWTTTVHGTACLDRISIGGRRKTLEYWLSSSWVNGAGLGVRRSLNTLLLFMPRLAGIGLLHRRHDVVFTR